MAQGDLGPELSEGEEFAGYRIERRLGQGGMGIVYLAIELRLDRRVALKLISPEAAAERIFRERFAHESRIAASIEHPNVVPIYAAGEEADIPYIAMRYVSGSDLGRRVTGGARLRPAHGAALIAQVANGLDAIHAAGLVHRDVKPANVLLSGDEGSEHAYLTDFGLARNVATTSGLTQTGRFVGTLDYVAPEQISGSPVDARADVYALGCLFFKLLTGGAPFPKEGEAARLWAHLNDPPPAASQLVPSVPRALDEVVSRAMSKAPDERYPSAGDLGRAAVAALSGEPVAVPEHTVAVGDAATRVVDTPAPAPARAAESGTGGLAPQPPTGETVPRQPTASGQRSAPTQRLPSEPGPGTPVAVKRRRRLALLGAGIAVAAIVAGAIALGGSGGGDGSGPKADDPSKPVANGGDGGQATPALSRPELVSKGDSICARSQGQYREAKARFPAAVASEATPDVDYSRALVEISRRAVADFGALEPPQSVRGPYEDYVSAQKRVHAYDVQALDAARRDDANAYLAAREIRNSEQPQRHQLAAQIGFQVCSAGQVSG